MTVREKKHSLLIFRWPFVASRNVLSLPMGCYFCTPLLNRLLPNINAFSLCRLHILHDNLLVLIHIDRKIGTQILPPRLARIAWNSLVILGWKKTNPLVFLFLPPLLWHLVTCPSALSSAPGEPLHNTPLLPSFLTRLPPSLPHLALFRLPTPLLSKRPTAGEVAVEQRSWRALGGQRQPKRSRARERGNWDKAESSTEIAFVSSIPLAFIVDLHCSRQPDGYVPTVNAPVGLIVAGITRDITRQQNKEQVPRQKQAFVTSKICTWSTMGCERFVDGWRWPEVLFLA